MDKQLTLDFHWGLDLEVMGSSPASGSVSLLEILSFVLPLPLFPFLKKLNKIDCKCIL